MSRPQWAAFDLNGDELEPKSIFLVLGNPCYEFSLPSNLCLFSPRWSHHGDFLVVEACHLNEGHFLAVNKMG